MRISSFLLYALVMAGVTYCIRMLPMVIFRRKIENAFVKSFLFYVPYAVLGAMTFPAVFFSTASLYSAIAGVIAACVLAYFQKSLLTVAIAACFTVFAVECAMRFLHML